MLLQRPEPSDPGRSTQTPYSVLLCLLLLTTTLLAACGGRPTQERAALPSTVSTAAVPNRPVSTEAPPVEDVPATEGAASTTAIPTAAASVSATPEAAPTLQPTPKASTTPLAVSTPVPAAANRCATIDAKRSGSGVRVTYAARENVVRLSGGGSATLSTISRGLNRPEVLREASPGVWLVRANLLVEKGAKLCIVGPEVRAVRLRSEPGAFVYIRVSGGQLDIEDTAVTSWDERRGGPDTRYADGRSFILARDGAEMNVRRAEISYLGYNADESFGLSWRVKGTKGELLASKVSHNYYGMYSWGVSGLVIRGNELSENVLYGIDPHTGSNRLTIESNLAHHNGKHGIILAEDCTDSVIRYNTTHHNGEHGIVLFGGSNGNRVESNTTFRNEDQGINVNDSSRNTLRGNIVYENRIAGIGVGQGATGNRLVGNSVRANRRDGVIFYTDATRNVLRDNEILGNERYGVYVKTPGNEVAEDNRVKGNGRTNIRRKA